MWTFSLSLHRRWYSVRNLKDLNQRAQTKRLKLENLQWIQRDIIEANSKMHAASKCLSPTNELLTEMSRCCSYVTYGASKCPNLLLFWNVSVFGLSFPCLCLLNLSLNCFHHASNVTLYIFSDFHIKIYLPKACGRSDGIVLSRIICELPSQYQV